jgi:hypothetical protein
MKIGSTVRANAHLGATGLPYLGTIEQIDRARDRALVRPLQHAATPSSARSAKRGRSGPSLRARWIKLERLALVPPPRSL